MPSLIPPKLAEECAIAPYMSCVRPRNSRFRPAAEVGMLRGRNHTRLSSSIPGPTTKLADFQA